MQKKSTPPLKKKPEQNIWKRKILDQFYTLFYTKFIILYKTEVFLKKPHSFTPSR